MDFCLRRGELKQPLPTSPASHDRFAAFRDNENFGDLALAGDDQSSNRRSLGTEPHGICGIFDIGARENRAGSGPDRGADGKVGIGRIGIGARRHGGFEKPVNRLLGPVVPVFHLFIEPVCRHGRNDPGNLRPPNLFTI